MRPSQVRLRSEQRTRFAAGMTPGPCPNPPAPDSSESTERETQPDRRPTLYLGQFQDKNNPPRDSSRRRRGATLRHHQYFRRNAEGRSESGRKVSGPAGCRRFPDIQQSGRPVRAARSGLSATAPFGQPTDAETERRARAGVTFDRFGFPASRRTAEDGSRLHGSIH